MPPKSIKREGSSHTSSFAIIIFHPSPIHPIGHSCDPCFVHSAHTHSHPSSLCKLVWQLPTLAPATLTGYGPSVTHLSSLWSSLDLHFHPEIKGSTPLLRGYCLCFISTTYYPFLVAIRKDPWWLLASTTENTIRTQISSKK